MLRSRRAVASKLLGSRAAAVQSLSRLLSTPKQRYPQSKGAQKPAKVEEKADVLEMLQIARERKEEEQGITLFEHTGTRTFQNLNIIAFCMIPLSLLGAWYLSGDVISGETPLDSKAASREGDRNLPLRQSLRTIAPATRAVISGGVVGCAALLLVGSSALNRRMIARLTLHRNRQLQIQTFGLGRRMQSRFVHADAVLPPFAVNANNEPAGHWLTVVENSSGGNGKAGSGTTRYILDMGPQALQGARREPLLNFLMYNRPRGKL